MRPADNVNELIKKLKLRASADLDKRVHDDISATLAEPKKTESAAIQPSLWRLIMKSPITKLAAAAAVIIIAVAISVTILDKSVTPAYAIEQTIEANRGLWFIHLKCEPSTHGSVDEIWAQFDDNRQLTNLRMIYLNTVDGPKDIVWHEGKAEVWFKAKKRIVVVREKDILAGLKMSYESFDPKRIVEELYQAQGSENVQIKIQESSAEGEPIIITMSKKPDLRIVYMVDPETKLLQQEESYKLKDGEYIFLGRIRYLDYNNPADSQIFVLKPPADVIRVDPTTQEIGLAKGELSDDEIAVEVVRQFFQALIAEDYTKAGRLFGEGFIPTDKMQQMFGHIKFLRIVSIEPAGSHPNPATKGLVVPCTVEIEKDGQIHQWKEEFGVRQVDDQPGRWTMCGF